MKKTIRGMMGAILALACTMAFAAGDAVEPASVAVTNIRNQAASTISAGTIYRGESLLLTNCVMYSDTEGSVVQGLSNCTVNVSCGNLSTNDDYEATVVVPSNGTWFCTVTIPDLSTFNVQVKVTDENTNSYIYANKVISAEQSQF